MPGMMEPSTCPQMPGTSWRRWPWRGATIMSQVEVPMIFTRVRSVICPPTPPMCASKAPTATAMPGIQPQPPRPFLGEAAGASRRKSTFP